MVKKLIVNEIVESFWNPGILVILNESLWGQIKSWNK